MAKGTIITTINIIRVAAELVVDIHIMSKSLEMGHKSIVGILMIQ